MQGSSHSNIPENIDLKDTWFTPDLEEDPRETLSHEPSVAKENNNKMLTLSHSVLHVQYSAAREEAYEEHGSTSSKGF